MRNLLSAKWRGELGSFILFAGLAPGFIICMSGVFTFFGQVLGWLKTGTWTPHTLYETLRDNFGMDYPRAGWWAGQKLLDFLMSWPASICLAIGGLALMLAVAFALAHPLDKLGLLGDDAAAQAPTAEEPE